jgi:hypothetical protein
LLTGAKVIISTLRDIGYMTTPKDIATDATMQRKGAISSLFRHVPKKRC